MTMSDLTPVVAACLIASRELLAALSTSMNFRALFRSRSQTVETMGKFYLVLEADVPGFYDASDTASLGQISAVMTEAIAQVDPATLGTPDEALLAVLCCAVVLLPDTSAETYLRAVGVSDKAPPGLLRNLLAYRNLHLAPGRARAIEARDALPGAREAAAIMERRNVTMTKIFHGLVMALARKAYSARYGMDAIPS